MALRILLRLTQKRTGSKRAWKALQHTAEICAIEASHHMHEEKQEEPAVVAQADAIVDPATESKHTNTQAN